MDKTLAKELGDENARVLKSDNIYIGEKIPLLNGMAGIIFGETEKLKKQSGGLGKYGDASIGYWKIGFRKKRKPAELFRKS